MATNGPDILTGTAGADVIEGLGGDDVIRGFGAGPGDGMIRAERIASGMAGAVFASSAPGRADELFVVRKDVGSILILDPATSARSEFLAVPSSELTTGGEQGLLGLAFHPGYAVNGRFFVHLVNANGDIEVREYARSASDPDRADPEPVRTLLTVPHPGQVNHNGGALAFSPRDGYLYVALGDGGGRNDPAGNAQNTATLLGKILRLDVDGDDFPGDPARNYAIPPDNPFVGASGADEIWAYGLRNPWRIAFDANGDLYIADVGQNAREEVNYQPFGSRGGENYGWDLAEGSLGNPPPGAVPPVFEYGHDVGQSITGGYIYRGDEPSLGGSYIFADFLSGAIWTLDVTDGTVTLRTSQIDSPDAPLEQISSFGVDGSGNLYVVSLVGNIFRLVPGPHAGDRADVLIGDDGADSLFGGPGDDDLRGGLGADVLRGGYGNDLLSGGSGRDRLFGQGGDDRLLGGNGLDRLSGQEGDDVLGGGAGDDELRGHDGADTLIGATGDDVLLGGTDADVFVFRPGDGNDRVVDFSDNEDRLDLTAFGLSGLAAVTRVASGTSTLIDLSAHGGGTVLLEGFAPSMLTDADVLI